MATGFGVEKSFMALSDRPGRTAFLPVKPFGIACPSIIAARQPPSVVDLCLVTRHGLNEWRHVRYFSGTHIQE